MPAHRKYHTPEERTIAVRLQRRMSQSRYQTQRTAATAKWRRANPEKCAQYRKNAIVRTAAWRQENRERIKALAHLKRYGETLAVTAARFILQGSCCAACSSPTPQSKKGWHTDHCRKTGEVRGVLCQPCNLILGHAKDNPTILALAVKYLERTNGKI